MYSIIRNCLFKLDAEVSHELSLDWLGAFERLHLLKPFAPTVTPSPVNVMGIDFPNRVGLAAGLDKNGDFVNALGQLGFGFIEIGTITPMAQSGNPKPRLFRLPEHEAIINRMGFNNKGVSHLVEQVRRRRYQGVLGINIGKNKVTPEENALDDYVKCMDQVYAHADYITVNISSPNTPGLRNLQFGETLANLLAGVKQAQERLAQTHDKYVPVAVKIAPDMTLEEIHGVADTLVTSKVDGVIATNTTVSREAVSGHRHAEEMGGLSGLPVRDKSTEVIASLSEYLKGELPIIGVGGILTGQDAQDKIAAGASLVQVYSGFIYKGPSLIAEAADAIASAGSNAS